MILVVAATEPELEGARDVETLVCGIGPVEGAAATARAIADRRPDAILHVGIAGARRLEPPQLVLGIESIYCDLLDGNARIPRVHSVLPDPSLLAAARRALPEAAALPIATSASVGGGTDAEVEAMEGFGVLRAAELARVPALELRAISNRFDEADRARWLFREALGALADAVPRLLTALA